MGNMINKIYQKILKLYSKTTTHYLIGIGIIIFFTLAYIVLLLNKYWQFEYFFVDNVYFDTAIWKVAHLQAPIVNHTALGRINILGDHFHPAIFLFSLLYLITSRQEIIFIGMSIVYGLSAFLAMLVGFKLVKSKFIIYSLLIAYFLYMGTQNAMIYGFHELILMPLFFFLTLFFLFYKHERWYWAGLVFLLLTKESLAAVAITLGIFIIISLPRKRKIGIITIAVSLIYFFIVTHYVIPHFSGKYYYSESSVPKSFGKLAIKLIDPPEKISTFLISNSTFGFLPFLNIATLPMVLQDFFVRYIFAPEGSIQYRLVYHYNLGLVPILLFSSLWSIHKLQKNRKLVKLLPLIGVAVLSFSIYYHRFSSSRGPLLLVFNSEFYKSTRTNSYLWKLVDEVPRDGKIMTQNHLGLAFAHDDVYQMTVSHDYFEKIDPKYVVFDLRDGQNPNNYTPISETDTKNLKELLLDSWNYKISLQRGSFYIFKKL